MTQETVVVASAEKHSSVELVAMVKRAGWSPLVSSFEEMHNTLRHASPVCVVLAVERGGGVSEETFGEIRAHDDHLPVVIVSSSKSLEEAVWMMKRGAYDYFSLPFNEEKFAHAIANAVRLYHLTKRVFLLESQAGWQGSFDDLIGGSPRMLEVYRLLEAVAKSQATVLIQGESGTGKELVAKAIHRHSHRAKKAFLDINCGAIPRELLENEMFGHERGAYTGADRRYIGSLERANGGTLFLDEIGEMDLSLQVKLLRFLQERTFLRVGGNDSIAVDVRIVAATNRDLAKAVAQGLFREDLYFRLNVIPITMPPLRERPEDIPLLAKHFLEKYSAKNEKIFVDIAPDALETLFRYEWPGNVRELENAIEHAVVLHNDSIVRRRYLPETILSATAKASPQKGSFDAFPGEGRVLPLELVERYAIESALSYCGGNAGEAASKLKIGLATLYRKIKQYGLRAGGKDEHHR